jgi:hypothetical protein
MRKEKIPWGDSDPLAQSEVATITLEATHVS